MRSIILVLVLLLAACTKPVLKNVEPENVTPTEIAEREQCVKFLSQFWPTTEPILYTVIKRGQGLDVEVSVNMDLQFGKKQMAEYVANGVQNNGLCEFRDGHMTNVMWFANVHYQSGGKLYTASTPDFKWSE